MVGFSTELLCFLCFCVFICNILAKQWTTYSYAPNGADNPLSNLRSCKSDTQNMTVCGVKRFDRNDSCGLMKMEACDGLGAGSGSFLQMRKTIVRLEQPFAIETFPECDGVHTYVPIHLQPGSQIYVVLTPLVGWPSILVGLYNASTPVSAYLEWEYSIQISSSFLGEVISQTSGLMEVQAESYCVPITTNEKTEIRISCETDSFLIYVNGNYCMNTSHVIPLQTIGQLRVPLTGLSEAILHSIRFEAAQDSG